ncbi:MAG TPA: SURF1 family protein [Mycobacterium sp.]|jgi:cytochrome oxidase assembly protein ShyY1|uniref:SURF1 family cytochrome oxidase biogenesis protein n=1 Tax=Mycobacterium sp. TaxID=1785 RepID=UPI002F41EE44
MRRLAFLLRPGWIALAVVVIAFTYLCFSVLAPWQLGKNTKTSRENDQIQQSLTTAPVSVTTLLPQQDSSNRDAQWRRVTATGHYLPDKQLVARLRVADGDPAMEVLQPFVVDEGPTVLVDRGYVRPLPGSRVPPVPPPPRGTVTITARLRDSEGLVPDKESFVSDGVRQVYSINTSQLATLTGVPLTGSYLQLVDKQPGGLGVIALPHLDAGPFLSYGIQWITFGVVAPILLGYFVYAEVQARRADKTQASPGKPADKPATVQDKLTDRYGRRR